MYTIKFWQTGSVAADRVGCSNAPDLPARSSPAWRTRWWRAPVSLLFLLLGNGCLRLTEGDNGADPYPTPADRMAAQVGGRVAARTERVAVAACDWLNDLAPMPPRPKPSPPAEPPPTPPTPPVDPGDPDPIPWGEHPPPPPTPADMAEPSGPAAVCGKTTRGLWVWMTEKGWKWYAPARAARWYFNSPLASTRINP